MKQPAKNQFADSIDECVLNGIKQGILHLKTENEYLDGRIIKIRGKEVVNFGSCSYLGLEVDDRLKQGAINAVLKYGTQFSSSRFYVSCGLYEELEDLISKIFNAPVLIAPSTSVAHAAAIPILINDNDAIILDHQAHASMQNAVSLLTRRGITVEMIKHNNLQMLEDKIRELSGSHFRIWYIADSVYSMYGDYAPLNEIKALLIKYSQLYYYVDDAHGMSCTGINGSGYVTSTIGLLPKMVLASSMAKGFGTGGGILTSLDEELVNKIKRCGSNLIFSGPIQPPTLGASIESAKIHLSDEITQLQLKLKNKIALADKLIREKKLPYVTPSESPILYLALGLPQAGYNMINRLINEGFYVDTGLFPAVSLKRTGIRIPINVNQNDEDIIKLINAIEYHYPYLLSEEEKTIDDLSSFFNMDFSYASHLNPSQLKKQNEFTLDIVNSISNVDKTIWDSFFEDRGSFDWEGCKFLEEVFIDNPEPENNWKFYYIIIKDNTDKVILATFFTCLLCKDDMLSPESVSKQIEEIRENDPYYLTSKVMMMGSLLTEGEHLYLDRENKNWQQAIKLMLEKVREIQKDNEASAIYLRDFNTDDIELRDFLIAQGFFRTDMSDVLSLKKSDWNNIDDYITSLSPKSRSFQRKEILPFLKKYNIITEHKFDENKILEWFNLYINVKKKSFKINTFNLPMKAISQMFRSKNWKIIEIEDIESNKIISVGFMYFSKNTCSPIFLGLDYSFKKYSAYRHNLFQTILFAFKSGANEVLLGMDAELEKTRFGAKRNRKSNYIQFNENYNFEQLSIIVNKK
jgi:7-keto-8-aminopelargonate synthetase-like enzyme